MRCRWHRYSRASVDGTCCSLDTKIVIARDLRSTALRRTPGTGTHFVNSTQATHVPFGRGLFLVAAAARGPRVVPSWGGSPRHARPPRSPASVPRPGQPGEKSSSVGTKKKNSAFWAFFLGQLHESFSVSTHPLFYTTLLSAPLLALKYEEKNKIAERGLRDRDTQPPTRGTYPTLILRQVRRFQKLHPFAFVGSVSVGSVKRGHDWSR